MHDLVDLVSRNPGFDMRRGDVEHFSGNLAECVQRQLGRWMMITRKSRPGMPCVAFAALLYSIYAEAVRRLCSLPWGFLGNTEACIVER